MFSVLIVIVSVSMEASDAKMNEIDQVAARVKKKVESRWLSGKKGFTDLHSTFFYCLLISHGHYASRIYHVGLVGLICRKMQAFLSFVLLFVTEGGGREVYCIVIAHL